MLLRIRQGEGDPSRLGRIQLATSPALHSARGKPPPMSAPTRRSIFFFFRGKIGEGRCVPGDHRLTRLPSRPWDDQSGGDAGFRSVTMPITTVSRFKHFPGARSGLLFVQSSNPAFDAGPPAEFIRWRAGSCRQPDIGLPTAKQFLTDGPPKRRLRSPQSCSVGLRKSPAHCTSCHRASESRRHSETCPTPGGMVRASSQRNLPKGAQRLGWCLFLIAYVFIFLTPLEISPVHRI